MSELNTKQALVQQLLTVADSSDIAFENKDFNPDGKPFWFACYYRGATEESTGKTLTSSDQAFGFFQVAVYTERNLSNYDNLLLEKVDLIKSAFRNTASVTYSGQRVYILDTSSNDARPENGWFKKDLTINYMTFSAR